jgi:uncharacterized paraquat-inducible protein A
MYDLNKRQVQPFSEISCPEEGCDGVIRIGFDVLFGQKPAQCKKCQLKLFRSADHRQASETVKILDQAKTILDSQQ